MDSSPVFWDMQGKMKYNVDKTFFNYETSIETNWNNKTARRVLVNLLVNFGKPNILDLQPRGIAIWTVDNLKNTIYKRESTLFNEIIVRDEYIVDKKGQYNPNYPFLKMYYMLDLTDEQKKSVSKIENYFYYDNMKHTLCVNSRTPDENLVMLHILLENGKLSDSKFNSKLKKIIMNLNKLSDDKYDKFIKDIIIQIKSKIKPLQNNRDLNEIENEDVIEEEYIIEEENYE